MNIVFIKIRVITGKFKSIKQALTELVSKDSLIKGLLSQESDSIIMVVTPILKMSELSSLIYDKIHLIEGVINTTSSIASANEEEYKKLLERKSYISFVHCTSNNNEDKSALKIDNIVKDKIKSNLLVAKISPTEYYILNEIKDDFQDFHLNNEITTSLLNSIDFRTLFEHCP